MTNKKYKTKRITRKIKKSIPRLILLTFSAVSILGLAFNSGILINNYANNKTLATTSDFTNIENTSKDISENIEINSKDTDVNLSIDKTTSTEEDDINNILENIGAIVDKYSISNDIAISFTDLSTNSYIGFNDTREFLGASTTKLPLALFICDKLEKGEIFLTDTINYSYVDYEEGAGVMLDSYNGQPYTINELLKNMIIYSDNIATNMFYRHFGYSETKKAIGDLVGININITDNIITSKQMNEFIIFLYSNKDRAFYSTLISLLTKTQFHDRLDYYLPYDIVAHKIGNFLGNTHDVGIVFLDKPYAISVFSDNIINAEEIISSLSKEIYEFYISIL